MAVLGLSFCARAFSSCGERGPLFIAVHGPLTMVASLVVEHRFQTCRLSSCGSRAQLLHGMWDLPRPGLEPMSPALAGRFSTTAPPGKPLFYSFYAIVNGIVFLILFFYCSLLLYRKTVDLWVLILYSATLLNSFINYSTFLWILQGFLHDMTRLFHLQIEIVLLLPF